MIDKIKKHKLCLGCGLCSSILGQDKCSMKLTEQGFYEPVVLSVLSKKESRIIKHVCPAVTIKAEKHRGVWGAIQQICEAWSSDANIRHKAASGGICTSLALYLLETHKVDAILQVGVRNDSYLYNELKISTSREEIINNAQSRYAPALIFHDILGILENDNRTYAFIGKPCDMAALQNLCREFPQYQGRIKYYISIFCAGMPSYNATEKTWKMSGHTDEPIRMKYRGDGWPGNFKAEFADGTSFQLSYNDSWGKVLGKSLGFRCKICPDGIGMLADIAVGDSWNTKDGYPDFTESEGRCFCMVRTEKGNDLMQEAEHAGYLTINHIELDKIQDMQSYQYNRRKLEGWRLLPVQIFTGFLLDFSGLGIFKQACSADIKTGIRNLIGTAKRMIKQ